MGGFLATSSIKTVLTGALNRHFETFSNDKTRNLVIFKEPLKTLISTPTNTIYGYGDSSNEASYTFTPVSGVYPAVIFYEIPIATLTLQETRNMIEKGVIRIKVEKDCRDFIEDGRRNEKLEFDGKSFNVVIPFDVQDFQGLQYFIYEIQSTK